MWYTVVVSYRCVNYFLYPAEAFGKFLQRNLWD